MVLTISPPDVQSDLLGAQRPRLLHVPEFVASTGQEAIELARMAGLELDPWQQFVLINALGERPDGMWAAKEVGVEVPRQNGKGGILEARELAGLFLLGERQIIHSAHEFATAEEALERMATILEGSEELSRRVKALKRSHGQEGVYLRSGQRLRYKTRTKGGGRGFSADCVILDEAMVLPEAMHGALMPTTSAIPNSQIWYTGSAVDQEVHEHGVVFSRVRERAMRGDDPRLAYFGWSPAFEHPNEVTEAAARDPEVWAQANPALGIRITVEHTAHEQRSMDPRTFAVERLGVGDWPKITAEGTVITVKTWASLLDAASEPVDPVCFAFDVSPDRSGAAIGVGGKRDDGMSHVEIPVDAEGKPDHRRGTGWLVDRLVHLYETHSPAAILYDQRSPAASLAPELEERGVKLTPVNAGEHAQACGMFFDAVDQRTLRHLGTGELLAAIRGATKRPLGDAWAWSRKSSSVDISPLVAVTLGLYGALTQRTVSDEPLVAFR